MTGSLPHALSARTLANCPLCLKPLPNADHSVSDRVGGVRIVGCPAMPTSEIMVTGVASAGSQEPAPADRRTCECDPMGEGLDHHPWCGRYAKDVEAPVPVGEPGHNPVGLACPECGAFVPEPVPARKFGSVDGALPVRDDRTRPSTYALTTALYRIPGAGDRAAARAELAALDGLWSELARVQDDLAIAREELDAAHAFLDERNVAREVDPQEMPWLDYALHARVRLLAGQLDQAREALKPFAALHEQAKGLGQLPGSSCPWRLTFVDLEAAALAASGVTEKGDGDGRLS